MTAAADVVRLAEQRTGRTAVPPVEPAGELSSWARVDLSSVLAGGYQPPQPGVLHRDDGQLLLYPGRTHALIGESESAKTWIALLAAAQELRAGHRVMFFDFEDDAGAVAGRLVALGLTAEQITAGFDYRRPERPLGGGAWTALATDLADPALPPCTLAILDGVTEAMSLHGLSPNVDVEVAAFADLIPRRLAALGPAVALLDHVVKDRESRGRWATGSQHKISGLSGSAFIVEAVRPFGVGMTGTSRMFVAKDRPGQVRPATVRGGGGRDWVGDFTMTSDPTGRITTAGITPPGAEQVGPFRPTTLMERISRFLESSTSPVSRNTIETAVSGKAAGLRLALDALVEDGYVSREVRGQSQAHQSVRPYREAEAADPAPSSEPTEIAPAPDRRTRTKTIAQSLPALTASMHGLVTVYSSTTAEDLSAADPAEAAICAQEIGEALTTLHTLRKLLPGGTHQ